MKAPAPPSFAGTYTHEGCLAEPNEDGTTDYLTITYVLTDSSWSRDVVMHGDEVCTRKQGTIHTAGTYAVVGPSQAVPGAFEVELSVSEHTVVPHVDGFVALLQSYSCGQAPYAVDAPQDLLEAGCKELGAFPVASCRADFDIIKREADGSLRLGQRPADQDRCTPEKRPTALGSTVFKPVG